MQIAGSTAVGTGANRGLGRHLAGQLMDRGATVYAASRSPGSVDLLGASPIELDVTNDSSVAATQGVALLVNNAGLTTGASLLGGSMADIDLEMRTHYFGTLAVLRAFSPQLAGGGGGDILNRLVRPVVDHRPGRQRVLRSHVGRGPSPTHSAWNWQTRAYK